MDDVLVWEAPARCPAEAKVRAEIAALVRPAAQRPRYEIRGRIEERAGRFTLQLTIAIEGAAGERTLSESSCETLTSAGTAIVALAVNAATEAQAPAPTAAPSSSSSASSPSPSSSAAPPPAPSAAPPPREPAPPAPPPTNARIFVGAWGAVELGSLPSAQPFAGLLAGYARGPYAFHAFGGLGPAQRVRSPEIAGAGAEVSTTVFGLAASRGLFGLPLGPTLGLSVARYAGRGEGVQIVPRDVASQVVRAEAGALAAYERGFLGLRLALLATVPLVRPTFVIGNDVKLFAPSSVGGRAELGIFARF